MVGKKDEELIRLRDFASEQRRKAAKGSGAKDVLKAKKQAKDRERELLKLHEQLKAARALNEEQRVLLEDAAKQRQSGPRP